MPRRVRPSRACELAAPELWSSPARVRPSDSAPELEEELALAEDGAVGPAHDFVSVGNLIPDGAAASRASWVEGSSCWGSELHGAPLPCDKRFTISGSHLKDKFCPSCHENGILVPAHRIRAIRHDHESAFSNSPAGALWTATPALEGLSGYRVVNHTRGCTKPPLLVFREALPPSSDDINAGAWTALPAGWLRYGTHIRLWPSRGTFVPTRPRTGLQHGLHLLATGRGLIPLELGEGLALLTGTACAGASSSLRYFTVFVHGSDADRELLFGLVVVTFISVCVLSSSQHVPHVWLAQCIAYPCMFAALALAVASHEELIALTARSAGKCNGVFAIQAALGAVTAWMPRSLVWKLGLSLISSAGVLLISAILTGLLGESRGFWLVYTLDRVPAYWIGLISCAALSSRDVGEELPGIEHAQQRGPPQIRSRQIPWLALLYQGYWALQLLPLTCPSINCCSDPKVGDPRAAADGAVSSHAGWSDAEWTVVAAALIAVNYAIGVAGTVSTHCSGLVAAAACGTLGGRAAVLLNEAMRAAHGEQASRWAAQLDLSYLAAGI